MSLDLVALDHPRFVKVQRRLFTVRVVSDCMSHSCSLVREGGRQKLDACCQYGADADVSERDRILARAGEIAPLLTHGIQPTDWFGQEKPDPDFPSGAFVRVNRHDDGCLFLGHDGRGCAIHRASLENDWDFRGTKPAVCRLFPLTFDDTSILLSDDYDDCSCSQDASAPSVYRVGRDTLADVFGQPLVLAMDRVEADVMATMPPPGLHSIGLPSGQASRSQ